MRLSAAQLALVGAAVLGSAPVVRAQNQPDTAPVPRVRILNPEPGAVLPGRTIPVVLEVQGIELAPAISRRPGTAHCDLFLDRDLTPLDSAIPLNTGGIVHLSRGQLWHAFEGYRPGPHRLIAVLVDPFHVPLTPLAADTVRFTFKPRP